MTALPPPQNSASVLIDRHHEANAEPPRPHMGCSLLGHPCDRYLWLSFRWASQEQFSGRMLRLFRRGQNEESVVVSDLRAIGVDVQATGASQSRVNCDCHVSGSVDGIIESGLPESPKKRHILEIKTYNRKSFDKLTKDGVQKTKFQHYVQMQLYMLGIGIDRAFYIAICKDSDEIYTERIRFDKELAEKYLFLVFVYLFHRFQHTHFVTHVFGHFYDGFHIFRETTSAVTAAGIKKILPDSGVAADSAANHIHIGAH